MQQDCLLVRLFASIGLVHILSRRMLERSKEHVHRKAVPYQARKALKWVLPSRKQVLPSRRQVLLQQKVGASRW